MNPNNSKPEASTPQENPTPRFRLLKVGETVPENAETWVSGCGPWTKTKSLSFAPEVVAENMWPIRVPIPSPSTPDTDRRKAWYRGEAVPVTNVCVVDGDRFVTILHGARQFSVNESSLDFSWDCKEHSETNVQKSAISEAETAVLPREAWMADSRPLLAEIEKLSAERDEAKLTASKILCEWGAVTIERDSLKASHSTLVEVVTALRDALDEIANSEGECCQRCEGNGRLWADGKAHHPNENMPTRPCPPCDGEGRIYPDIKQIAIDALALLDSPPVVDALRSTK